MKALAPAQAALTRMRRAFQRGTGCHLTAEMLRSLSLTSIAETWEEDPSETGDDDE